MKLNKLLPALSAGFLLAGCAGFQVPEGSSVAANYGGFEFSVSAKPRPAKHNEAKPGEALPNEKGFAK